MAFNHDTKKALNAYTGIKKDICYNSISHFAIVSSADGMVFNSSLSGDEPTAPEANEYLQDYPEIKLLKTIVRNDEARRGLAPPR